MGVLLWITVIVATVLIFYWKKIFGAIRDRYRLVHYVDKLVGPTSIPLLGTTWQLEFEITKFTKQLGTWGDYYARQGHGMCRLWIGTKPLAIVIKPEWAKSVLESNVVITKGPEYSILLPWLGRGLLTSYGKKWRSRRKLLTPTFHFNVLNDFLTVHDSQSQVFLDQLEPFAESGKEFDIFPYVKRCALDIICETSMGFSINSQTNHNHPYVMAVQRMNEVIFVHQRMPWMWLKPIWYLSGYGYEYDELLKTLLDFTRKVIEERVEEYDAIGGHEMIDPTKKKAFLDLLLDMRHEGDLTDEDIREEVDTFMFEGHDTTAASLGWTIWCVAHHPEVQQKVCEEVDRVFGSTNRNCTNEDLKQLKYLERVIKESLRMYPSVPMMTRIAEEDVDINGTLIPKGCPIVIAPQMIHTNPEVFENPLSFNPDNFSEENLAKRHPYAFIPFSAGPRNCIGQKFALMEEKTVLSWFFRHYTVSSSLSFKENTPCPEIILKPSIGFPVQLRKRF